MEFYDTFDENGVFLSAEDEADVHYKGLWHKVIRVWLFDNEGNIYLRKKADSHKLDCINELHMQSSESVSSCFDRAMFEKLGIHFPATSKFEQVCMHKIKKHRVYSDNSELKDYYFLCDYIGEYDKSANFFIFSNDTEGLVKCNAKGILNLLSTRTGEVVSYNIDSTGTAASNKEFIKIENIYEDPNEDTYAKYSQVVNAINENLKQYKKEQLENEKIKKLMDKYKTENDEYESHADENEGNDIY